MSIAESPTRSAPPAAPRVATPPETPREWVALFGLPVALCGLSMINGGIPQLTDLGFLMMAVLCVAWVWVELPKSDQTFRFGGLILFGGAVIWFSIDYLTKWFGVDYADPKVLYSPEVVCRAAFFHTLFMLSALVGLQLRSGRMLEDLILKVPEPRRDVCLFMVVTAFVVGISPYFLFSRDPMMAIYQSSVGMYSVTEDLGGSILEGRTGALNHNWSAYVSHIKQVGEVGAIFAVFFALMMSPGIFSKGLCWMIWGFWLLQGYGSGSRGQLLYFTLPILLLVLIRDRCGPRPVPVAPFKKYMSAGLIGVLTLVLIQAQISFRNLRVEDRSLEKVETSEMSGNTMFSEALIGWKLIPAEVPFFANQTPGEGAFRAVPDTLIKFVIEPIPRALWPDKPVDQVSTWLSRTYMGTSEAFVGGFTLAPGLVTDWYIRYGFAGVVEGGLLFGWLAGVSERTLARTRLRPMAMMFCFGLLTWLFRCFRGFSFHLLYPLLIGLVALYAFNLASVVRPIDEEG